MDAFKIEAVGSQTWWLILNTSTQEAKQVHHYEFNANLVYPSKFQAYQNYMVKPYLKHRSWKRLAPARMTSCFPGGERDVQRRWWGVNAHLQPHSQGVCMRKLVGSGGCESGAAGLCYLSYMDRLGFASLTDFLSVVRC